MNMPKREIKPECPCKGCEKRSAICHSVCEDYKIFREKLDAYNSKLREQKAAENSLFENAWKRGSELQRLERKKKRYNL